MQMRPFDVNLRGTALQRWGEQDAAALAPALERIEAALDVLAGRPSVEPGAWPPATLPPAIVPRLQPSDGLLQPHPQDPLEAGIIALAHGISAGTVSPVEAVEALLQHSHRLQPVIEAWASLDEERVRKAAVQREEEVRRGIVRGALHGVPLGIKDIIDVTGLPTRANSAVRANAPPALDDAAAVARLRQAGALFLGKTATTEFALADPSPARNPWRHSHTPGGSSSGSAAAVAARLVPGALGTQTAGSVLRPAAFCGVVGFKPSSGRISRDGILPLAWSLDHVGTLTRSVADAAALYAAMLGASQAETHGLAPGAITRIGFAGSFLQDRTDAAMRDALAAARRTLDPDVSVVRPIDLDPLGAPALAAHQVIMAAEAAAFHLGAHADRLADLGPRLRALVQAGALIPAEALLRARGVRRLLWERWDAVLRDHDAIIVPSAPGPAPEGLDFTGDPALNTPWSLLGVPAITIPIALAENGLPLGMQLVAPFGEDAHLLEVAAWCEQRLPFNARPSP